jgi:beta-lactamase class A
VSIADCIRVTIHVSDNLCHWDLVALVGEQTLNNQFCAEGYTRTVYEGRGCSGTSYSSKRTTTNDVALLLTRLETGELLSPELTDYYLDLLETQVWRHRIPPGVQRGVPIANKTGYLWVSTGYIHADTAIISGPSGPLVVTIIGSRNATANGVRDLGRIVYEHVNGPVTSGQSYGDRNLETRQTTTYYRYGSTSTPLGTLPAGTRVSAHASARTW